VIFIVDFSFSFDWLIRTSNLAQYDAV
jgi:hypothetical protein